MYFDAKNDLRPIYFKTQLEVDHVLDHLTERIAAQGYATVSNLLSIAGLETSEVHQHFGWISTREFETVKANDGVYELHVPNFQHLYQLMQNGNK